MDYVNLTDCGLLLLGAKGNLSVRGMVVGSIGRLRDFLCCDLSEQQ